MPTRILPGLEFGADHALVERADRLMHRPGLFHRKAKRCHGAVRIAHNRDPARPVLPDERRMDAHVNLTGVRRSWGIGTVVSGSKACGASAQMASAMANPSVQVLLPSKALQVVTAIKVPRDCIAKFHQ